MIITIDGPSGAGKSTIAKKVSEKLGFEYLDTGAMYRSITLFLLENGIDIKNEKETENFITDPSFNSSFDLKQENSKIYVNNNDVSIKIRQPIITDNVSLVSSYGFIRELLVDKQRKMSEGRNIILDGRDTGSVVFPNADLKIFLTASVEERAKRRFKESKGISYEEVYKSIEKRDHLDSTREISPLTIPENAEVIDSTNLSIDEIVNLVENKIKEKRNVL